jgi:hypothetical protein
MAKNNDKTTAIANTTNAAAPTTLDDIGQAELLAMMRPASAASLAERVASGELESAPMLFTIPEGQEITCEVVRDDVTTIEDVATRADKQVRIWILRMLHPATYAPGPMISILGSAQLDRQLPAFMGCVVVIARGGTSKTNKGRQLTEYFVGLDKRAAPAMAARRTIDVKSSEV